MGFSGGLHEEAADGWGYATRTIHCQHIHQKHVPCRNKFVTEIIVNPVREGETGDPKDYEWRGYARAVVREKDGERGILSLWGERSDQSDWLELPRQDGAG